MHDTKMEAVEFASYHLKDIAIMWYKSREGTWDDDAPYVVRIMRIFMRQWCTPIVWDELRRSFIDHFLPQEFKEANDNEFTSLR